MATCKHPRTKSFRLGEGYNVVCQLCGVRWTADQPHQCDEDIKADKARFDSYVQSQKDKK